MCHIAIYQRVFISKITQKIINVHCYQYRFYFQNSIENYQCVTLPILFSKQHRNLSMCHSFKTAENYQCVTLLSIDILFSKQHRNVSMCHIAFGRFQNSIEIYQCVTLPSIQILFSKQHRNLSMCHRFYFRMENYQCIIMLLFFPARRAARIL